MPPGTRRHPGSLGRVDPRAFLDELTADTDIASSLVHVQHLPARAPAIEPFPDGLPDLLVSRLGLTGVRGLYPHQADGLAVLRDGRDLVIATGTASGKTLVYNAAFAEAALTRPKATALYLYPTKALARDQLRAVRALKLPQVKASVYDGDTPRAERPLIRKNANLVMTNPDMLHLSLLPDHARWADFFFRLSMVVVDEAHVCRGVFGSHVAMVLRRLRRLIAHYGGTPRWCLASATVGNPGELATRLTGMTFDEVTDDRSPRGEKLFAFWNPPVVDEDTGQRRSALSEASWLMGRLADRDVRTIGFTRSRRAAELLAEFARRDVAEAKTRARIKSYRAGYLAEDRRRIERELADGDLIAIASTSALELGIDIGTLDAAVLTGYPGTRASMWQQAGRAGRRDGDALAILVAQDDPLDQYLVNHPDDIFERPPEAAVIDPTNPYVLEPHLRCAAREVPLREEELGFFGDVPDVKKAVERMTDRGELVQRREAWHDRGKDAPHRAVDVRAGGGHVYSIVIAGTGELLGTADEHRAYATLHPGAVYLHMGEQYLVEELDLVQRVAVVASADPDYYTQARDVTDIEVADVLSRTEHRRGGTVVRLGARHEPGDQLRAQARGHGRGARRGAAAAAARRTRDPRRVVDDPGERARPRCRGTSGCPGCDPRRRTRRDRPAAVGGHLRSVGHRRRLHADAPRHRHDHDLHLRRVPGRRGDHRARGPRCRPMAARHARGDPPVSVFAGMSLVRAVAEMRQRQRAARQDRGGVAARRDPRRAMGLTVQAASSASASCTHGSSSSMAEG